MKNENKSFTLIETLVAVAILSAAVAGPLVLSIKNIGSASVSQDQLAAFYLVQEVMEYVRNVRDTNLINASGDWLDGLSACKGEGSVGCYIDVENNTVVDCGASNCPKLKFDGQNYNYQNISEENNETVFTRTVKIIQPMVDEAQIDVKVEWTGKYGSKIMTLQDNIFNWR